ncbi:MAG: hypothetical protein IT423_08875 [Pirellulaceae bacterium]|nr:hypothetical protein [Pirellulaceae bacterium]
MDTVRKQAKLAKRRLVSERFFKFLPVNMLVMFGIALVGLALPLIIVMSIDKVVWFASWLIGAVVLSLIVNSIMTLVGRPTLSDAAIEIDRRFGLRERLSSALMLGVEDRESELGQALAADAEKRAAQLDVRDKFNWGLHRGLLLPALPALLALGLWFAPLRENAEDATLGKANVNQIASSTKPLIEQLKKKREEAEKQGLNEAADMFRKLEGKLAELQKDTKLDTKQSLAKLNDIKQQLEKRREELGSSEAMKKNLQNLEKFEPGPADELAQALKRGDFDKAEKEAEKLLEKMKSGEGLSEEDMQKLEKQLSQLEKALQEAAQAHEQAKQELEKQMKQAEAAGDLQKAAQMERKLAEMQAKDSQMQQMQELADSLSQCKECMGKGDKQGAQDSLQKMASQLQKMSAENGELQDLDQLMDSLSQSKSQMACSQCNGKGCSKCMNAGMGKMGEMPGMGMGEGRGQGERPEEETDTDFFESRVRDPMKQGETVYGGQIGGENRKGVTTAEVQAAVLTSLAEEPEPLDNQPLPKSQLQHTREYFNAIRDGKAPGK